MWKKVIYVLIALFVGYFIYVIFYKTITPPDDTALEEKAKTKKVVYYLKDDAIIYADEQIGTPEDKEIRFKNVIVDLLKKDVMISGNKGIVDTETQNMDLKGKVIGKTKDNKWNLFTEEINYKKETDKLTSNTRSKAVNNEDKTTVFGDKLETTTTFKEVILTGNIDFQKDKDRITSDSAIYYTDLKKVDAKGKVHYVGEGSDLKADSAVYEMITEILTANGNVHYIGNGSEITAGHAIYDMKGQIVNATGGGMFKYPSNNVDGVYIDGIYNLKEQILDTNSAFTLNNDGYIIKGNSLHYVVGTGDATVNSNFTVRKENIVVGGTSGTANTKTKNIFSNRMVMTSDQGDLITSNTGEGNFEKKEFRFDGNIDGKIRGNVKDFAKSKEMLVDANAIYFKGDTAKMYFLVHEDNKYSMTRGEIKNNVNVRYKDLNASSQYSEIDAGKNVVLSRDNVRLRFRESTQMTSNYFYIDLNTEKGYAQTNVKIINNIGIGKVDISADKAVIDNKTRKIDLIGNVVTYKDRTRISSDKAFYELDKKVLQNENNIKVDYYLKTNDTTQNDKKTEKKDTDAVDEIFNKLSVEEIRGSRISLPKGLEASNKTPVSIKWESSNSGILDRSGRVNKEYYGGKSSTVTLTAELTSGNARRIKTFNVGIPSENVEEMLDRASSKVYIPNTVQAGQTVDLPSTTKVNVYGKVLEIPLEWNRNDRVINNNQQVFEDTQITSVLKFNGRTYRKTYNIKVR